MAIHSNFIIIYRPYPINPLNTILLLILNTYNTAFIVGVDKPTNGIMSII
jgi:hypothetical protein